MTESIRSGVISQANLKLDTLEHGLCFGATDVYSKSGPCKYSQVIRTELIILVLLVSSQNLRHLFASFFSQTWWLWAVSIIKVVKQVEFGKFHYWLHSLSMLIKQFSLQQTLGCFPVGFGRSRSCISLLKPEAGTSSNYSVTIPIFMEDPKSE